MADKACFGGGFPASDKTDCEDANKDNDGFPWIYYQYKDPTDTSGRMIGCCVRSEETCAKLEEGAKVMSGESCDSKPGPDRMSQAEYKYRDRVLQCCIKFKYDDEIVSVEGFKNPEMYVETDFEDGATVLVGTKEAGYKEYTLVTAPTAKDATILVYSWTNVDDPADVIVYDPSAATKEETTDNNATQTQDQTPPVTDVEDTTM